MSGRKQPADPAERARLAAQECRAAAREAHEAIQAVKEVLAEVRAVVPGEVARQLAELGPKTAEAMDTSVAKVIAEFDRLKDILLGCDEPGRPSIEQMIAARAGRTEPAQAGMPTLTCPSCLATHQATVPFGGVECPRVPEAGSALVCMSCGAPSVVDTAPRGHLFLRHPTEAEAALLADDSLIQTAIRAARRAAAHRGTDQTKGR